jgi:hypothetical protein
MRTRKVATRKQQKGNKRRRSVAATRRQQRQRGGNAKFQGALLSAKFFLNEQIFPGLRLLNTALLDAQNHSPSEMDDNVASLLHHAKRMEKRAEKIIGKLDAMSAGHTTKSIIRAQTPQ